MPITSNTSDINRLGAQVVSGVTEDGQYEVLCHECELGWAYNSIEAAEQAANEHNDLRHNINNSLRS